MDKTLKTPITFRGSSLARGFLRLFGWQVVFEGLPGSHGVIIVYPHTSNWDFVVGILAKWATGIPLSFWAKEGLFTGFAKYTLGPLMRFWGAVPVERSSSHGVVQQTVAHMRAQRFAWLALAPEGSRRLKPHLRSGFYRVAVELQVPLGLAYFDFEHKVVRITEFLMPSGDSNADLAAIAAYYDGIKGYKPALASPISFAE
jgi:1-acyl-sn-glycerol-3-phosphate acyltransferase